MIADKSTTVATDKPDCAPLGLLESSVCDYEKNTGMSALNYRGLPKRSALKVKLDAANADSNEKLCLRRGRKT